MDDHEIERCWNEAEEAEVYEGVSLPGVLKAEVWAFHCSRMRRVNGGRGLEDGRRERYCSMSQLVYKISEGTCTWVGSS